MSLSVEYDYIHNVDTHMQEQVKRYWTTLHPIPEQCEYMIKTLARQLYGDHGNELFHIHAGFQGSASNGKTKFFEIMESCLGLVTPIQLYKGEELDVLLLRTCSG